MEGFTNVNLHRRHARKAADAVSDARIPGALWSDAPMSRSHLSGIPYSYYDDEIVMIRQRTAELVERQRAEVRARSRTQRQQPQQPVPEGSEWYTLDNGQVYRASSSQWQGVDE